MEVMSVVPMKQILDRAFNEPYGVAAIDIFNDLTPDAVLRAAVELDSPPIVPTSVKTMKWYGVRVLHSLHLDRCPDRAVISTALKVSYIDANPEFLQNDPTNYDPPSLFKYVRDACKELTTAQILGFQSAGKAA
jgi:fructose/tagatose bisphosphate aldolase